MVEQTEPVVEQKPDKRIKMLRTTLFILVITIILLLAAWAVHLIRIAAN